MTTCKECIHFDACLNLLRKSFPNVCPDMIASVSNKGCCSIFKRAADVVEVVRCQECKYYNSNQYNCFVMRAKVRPADFCSHGERKETNE